MLDSASRTTPPPDPWAQGDQPQPGNEVGAKPGALRELWEEVQGRLRHLVAPEQFETWFRRAAIRSVAGDVVDLAVQNGFAREWLESYYRESVEEALQEVLGSAYQVVFSVDPELVVPKACSITRPGGALGEEESESAMVGGPQPKSGTTPTEAGAGGGGSSGTAGQPSRSPLDAGRPGGLLWNSDVVLNPKYTFDNFVVGPCNRFAHAASMGAGESPGKSYNPLFLHGSVGLGKTHLLQSACFSILDRWPESRILYLSCETFVNHFINALENGDLASFRHKYRSVDVLVVDDIHMLANKEKTQEEFFHTFNTLYNAGKQIVLSSDSQPKDIPTLQERLVSRFKWGLVTEIETPCYETRVAILKRKSRERGHELADEVAQLIAERIETNVRELEGAVNKLISYGNLTGKKVDVDLTREALRDIFSIRRGEPSMDDIVQLVVQHFGVKLSELQSKRRTASITYPRQIAMYLARQVTRHSLEEVGRFFGGRDHSTVLYAIDRINGRLADESECRAIVERFLNELRVR